MAEEIKNDDPLNEGARRKAKIRNAGDEKRPRVRSGNAPVAKDLSIRRRELADPSEIPGNKEVPSALPGAEMGDLGTAAGSAAAGTKGASKSSEGRKGNPGNFGANQAGPGLATGPMSTTPDSDSNK